MLLINLSNVRCVLLSLSLSHTHSLYLLKPLYLYITNTPATCPASPAPAPAPLTSKLQIMCVFCVFVSFVFDLFILLARKKSNKTTSILGIFCELFPPHPHPPPPTPHVLRFVVTVQNTHSNENENENNRSHDIDNTSPRSRCQLQTILRFPSENLTSRAFQSNMDEILLHIQETEARVHHAPVQSDESQLYATGGA